ncbi:Na/Pi cotransporter family protein [Butyrivibrio sp. AE2032]|uniref:Na/Pi cotransporter family protein n=1 Tax=Butyrivibrio sp. AE2032 TaxID=1458463 RepID=UPI000691F278|nr:Na/Pi cotransporter family protein [Butyrivibrio sp. AE2032]
MQEVDVWAALVELCAGMALFLYSVKITSGSLQTIAGDKLKNVLAKLTGNRIMGVAVGAGITALIQSSTATSVMAVGFVNAGLMNLYQALWVIMGANIGTNITAQLIAFDVGAFAPIVALLGTFFCLLTKDKKLRSIGEAVAGLGFIFVAMSLMKESMAPLSEMDIVKEIFSSINNPFIGIIVGIIFVIIIQSSAAGVGVLQAMAMSASGAQLITLEQAMFIIFGLNIGTCVTAVFASIGGSRNATRAGMLHMLFNVIGTAIFTLAYYLLPIADWVRALSPNDVARQFANMHLVFNLASTIILLPFGTLIVKLVKIIVPDKRGDEAGVQCLKYLNPNMISNNNQVGTEVLIRALCNETSRMLEMAGKNVQMSIEAVLENSEKTQETINETEEYVDYLNKEISYYISHAMVFDMSEKDAVAMSALFKITGNIERMGDHATNISGYANLLESKGLRLSDKARAEVSQMVKTTKEAYDVLLGSKPGSVHIKMAKMEQKIDDMTDDYREHQLERLKSGVCSGDACVIYSEMLTDFERLGDHMLNIAEAAAESNLISLKVPEEIDAEEKGKAKGKPAAAKA